MAATIDKSKKKMYGIFYDNYSSEYDYNSSSYYHTFEMKPKSFLKLMKFDTIHVHSLDTNAKICVDIVVMLTDSEYEMLKKNEKYVIHNIDKNMSEMLGCKKYTYDSTKSYLSNISNVTHCGIF